MGKHSDTHKAAIPWPTVLLLALGTTATVIAWVYLVSAAITFGLLARSGQSNAWVFMAAASLGAVACLFVALILLSRGLRIFGLLRDPSGHRSERRR